MSRVVGIRGATTVDENTKESIRKATTDLLKQIVEANEIDVEDVAACYFTTTVDLNADFPAHAARAGLGWNDVALLCGHEMQVPGGLPMCLRVLLIVNSEKRPSEVVNIYAKGAAHLRSQATGP